MTLVLQVLTHNDAHFLPHLFASLRAQTDRNWTVYLREQSDHEEERRRIRSLAASSQLPCVVEEGENLGFAGGHQHLFEQHRAELVILLNADLVLTPTYVAVLRRAFESDPSLASAAGLIYRFELQEGAVHKTSVVDSAGLTETPWGRVKDRTEIFQNPQEVFGVSGCAPMVRRAAVLSASPDGLLFDPLYHSYKEDVDLAYRLRREHHRSLVIPQAVCYHHRALRSGWTRVRASAYQDVHSYRNHLWNLYQHVSRADWMRRGWMILPYEAAKAAYVFLRHPSAFVRAWRDTWRQRRHLAQRRKALHTL